MSISARFETTLFEFDGPQVALATDAVGGRYLLVLVERNKEVERFLAISISPNRLASLRSGEADLRMAFTEPEMGIRFVAETVQQGKAGELLLQESSEIPSTWLPEPGFVLPASRDPSSMADLARSARGKNRAIIECSLEPPQVSELGVIPADLLSEALRAFQDVIRLAYRKAIATTPSELRALIEGDENASVEVLAFAEGSFKVRLQSRTLADLSGSPNLVRALSRIDELTRDIDSPRDAFEAAKRNRGHLIYAYQRLLHFVASEHVAFSYRWADPTISSDAHRIPVQQAAELYGMLIAREELSAEEVMLVGRFVKAGVRDGKWQLRTEDNKIHSGQCQPREPSLLDGVTLTTLLYRLHCEEHLEETAGSGRHTSRLILVKLEPLGPVL